ncbi:MAG: hypothetical protein CM15mP74_20190 [Halieaceae bacterium]|nr:MAG: hypothetical protein CM15mP74_20190 [Halieaceae bacterium]
MGSIMLKYEVARFARTMGTLLHNGVAMLRATDIAVGTVGNSLIRASLVELPQTIKRGGRLSQALDPACSRPSRYKWCGWARSQEPRYDADRAGPGV